jgi:hypothetical protein
MQRYAPCQNSSRRAWSSRRGSSDALIVGWRDKYLHLFWRPETAIRNADSDGNDATAPDTAWEGLRSPFPVHPEYPSGHALFTAWKTRVCGRGFISAAPTSMAPQWVGGSLNTR